MKTYNTIQRQLIVDFLKKNADRQFTIEEISEKNAGDIGKSTIYRLINRMVKEGSVRRMVKGNSRQFLYQYADIVECSTHLHMKCSECGKLFHMNDEQSKELMQMLHTGNRFDLDMKETLLMGTCETCHIGDIKEK